MCEEEKKERKKERKKEERRTENRFNAVGEFISSKKYTLSLPNARIKGVRLWFSFG